VRLRDECKANRRVAGVLAPGPEDRTDRCVRRRLSQRLAHLLDAVRRVPHDRLRTEQRACIGNREIVRRLRIPMWKMPFIARYMRRRVAMEVDAITLFAGVGSLLHRLRDGQKTIAIVSSNSEANIRRILGAENAKTISYFSCGAGLFGKARLLRKVMKRSGAHPFTTLCVGDETRDIDAARRVGAIAAAVTWGYASTEVLREFKPDVVFESIEEIADYVLVERMAH